jgi:hypothetical protein
MNQPPSPTIICDHFEITYHHDNHLSAVDRRLCLQCRKGRVRKMALIRSLSRRTRRPRRLRRPSSAHRTVTVAMRQPPFDATWTRLWTSSTAAGSPQVRRQSHTHSSVPQLLACAGLTLLFAGAPPSLQPLLESRPNVAEAMAQQIKARIYDTWEPLCADTSGVQSGIHSSDLSSAQCSHFPAIERLARLPSQHSLRLAYEVTWYLKDNSYGDMDDDRGFGNRPSDEQGDMLLARLIRDRRAAGETWDYKRDLVDMDREAHHMATYSIDCWYPESRALLREALRSESQGSDKDAENQPDPLPSKDKLTKANLDMFSAYEKDKSSEYLSFSAIGCSLAGKDFSMADSLASSEYGRQHNP